MDTVRVISHWDHLLDGFQYSPQAFYASLDAALAKRTIPNATASRIELTEGPVLSATREYLRVKREEYMFDICAAPFGSGVFVSWWLVKPSRRGLLYALLLILALVAVPVTVVLLGVMMAIFGFFFGVIGTMAFVVGGVGALGYAIRRGLLGIEDDVLALPFIGAIYDWFFKPFTYYRIDTARMFEAAVHVSVLEVVDGLSALKGTRTLSDLERKPILREFYNRSGRAIP